jgi:hypothetical protein
VRKVSSLLCKSVLAAVAVLAILAAVAAARPGNATGVVVHVKGGSGATVTLNVSSGSPRTITQTADSKADTTFSGAWPASSQASATATLGGTTFTGNTKDLTPGNNTINVFAVSAVPEFGTVAAVVAVLLGATAFFFFRRRRLAAAR